MLSMVFVPTAIFGAVAVWRRVAVVAGVLAIVVGVVGIATLVYLDRTNTMLSYERWLQRGLPGPHEPSQPSDVR